MHLQFRSGTPSGYPASVSLAGLQAVWDLRVNGVTTVGHRTAPTKVLGVDTLPSGFTYDGQFLRGTGTATMDNWDLTSIASNGYVYTDGSGTVTFNDCIFGFHPSTTASYSLVSGDTGTPSTVCNYCTFDGDRTGQDGPSSGVLGKAGTLTLNYCDVVGQPEDGIKTTGGDLIARYCRIQNVGWDIDSDPDGMQIGGGSADVQYCLFDVRDGSELGGAYTGQPLNNFFRAESFAAAISSIIFKNNICVGIQAYSAAGGFTSIDAKDINPNAITSVLYENNAIEKGKSVYTYQDGSARYPTMTAGEWINNIDFDDSSTIPVPG